jgi:large subunit ribosomal protein L30
MTKIKITQIKSGIDRPERQKLTLRALGLNKLNASREVEATAPILGMVRKVNHLIKIEETEGGSESVPKYTDELQVADHTLELPVAPSESITTVDEEVGLPTASAEFQSTVNKEVVLPSASTEFSTTPDEEVVYSAPMTKPEDPATGLI